MIARLTRTEGISAATVGALATAVNAWLAAAGETQIVSIQYQFDGATHCALILYTE